MRKFLIILSLLCCMLRSVATQPVETLHYKVMFKWGLINKKAGSATLTLTPKADYLQATLTARSESWADGIYKLRDTLYSHMDPEKLTPHFYERIAHEDGKYSRDIVRFARTPGSSLVVAKTERIRRKDSESEAKSVSNKLSASGVTVDMVSAFYYLRKLDFAKMEPGQSVTVNIFSAKKKELLRIIFRGREKLKVDGKNYDTWRISFTFTTDGATKSSDNIETWLETTGNHAPVKLRGKLKVGAIQCLLENRS